MPTCNSNNKHVLTAEQLALLKQPSPWTLFWDMHSGGGSKEPFGHIWINETEGVAKIVFYNRFGHAHNRVSCTCCGEDYAVHTSDCFEEGSAFHRGVESTYRKEISVEDYAQSPDVHIIFASDIKPEERFGTVPVQGYVWQE